MVYGKVMKICFAIAIIMLVTTTIVFAQTDIDSKDNVIAGGAMTILKTIQKYSWPVAIVVLVFALYQYYVIGSEAFENKVNGQKLIVGISVFMAILQSLPLLYAIITIGW